MASDLQHRLVAILAADGVQYSRLMARDERGTLAALDAARGVFATHISARGGRIVDMAGDSVLAVFGTVSGAVETALAVQRDLAAAALDQLADKVLRYRIGIHLGDVIEKSDGSVYGNGVNVAARVQALAKPGAVAVSGTLRGALGEAWPHLRFDDQGSHEVRNIAQPVHVFGLSNEEERDSDAAPSKDGDGGRLQPPASVTDLPLAGEPLLGRDQDALALSGLLERNRLVTVVGPGGIGKTSLALAVARQVLNRFTEGARWVDLSTLSDPGLIVLAIAGASGVRLGEGAGVLELTRALTARHMLIVLDNCEHLAAGLAASVQSLLAGAPSLKLLATSQQVLQVNGERVYRLETLAAPEPNVSLDQARRYPAIALLEQRAQARDQHFELNPSTISQAIELCRSLDGLALAIEMAAARLPALGFGAVLAGLASLSSPSRTGPARQKTLHATLEWSHRLLSDEERAVLRRLSVFSGSFELEPAQHVAASKDLDSMDVTDALTGLVDKSLVQVQRLAPPRYRLLLSMKDFAAQQLAASGELDPTLRLHGIALAEVARRADQSSWLMPEGRWLARYALDYGDMQAAFDRAVLRRDPAVAGAIGEVLIMIENRRAVGGPQMRRINAAIALLDGADPLARAHLWNCIAPPTLSLAPRGMSRLESASARLSAWRELGDREQVHVALGYLAIEQARVGQTAAANESLAAMEALADHAWPPRRRWEGAWRRAHVREFQGDAAGCIEGRREGVAIAEAASDESLAELSRIGLAEANLLLNDHESVLRLISPLVDRLRSRNDGFRLVWALDLLCAALLIAGEVERARSAAREMLPLHRQLDTTGWASIVLSLLATGMDEHSTAAKLLGHSASWFDAREIVPEPVYQHISTVAKREVDLVVGVDRRVRMWAEGTGMLQSIADALADTLVGSNPLGSKSRRLR